MEKRQITEEENRILSEYGILSDEIVNPGIQVYERGEILIDDGKPLTEVAQLMGLSYGAVKLRHQAALAKLRGAFGQA